jgi:hypothetical protein
VNPERWGSALCQEKYQGDKICCRRQDVDDDDYDDYDYDDDDDDGHNNTGFQGKAERKETTWRTSR